MKSTTIKPVMLTIIAIVTGHILQAQTENVGERFSTQLKNGTVPGLQFSSVKPVSSPAANSKPNEKESLIMQIRKGTAAGMQFKPGTGTGIPVLARAATVAVPKQPLPSEQPVAKLEQAKPVAAPVVPKQE